MPFKQRLLVFINSLCAVNKGAIFASEQQKQNAWWTHATVAIPHCWPYCKTTGLVYLLSTNALIKRIDLREKLDVLPLMCMMISSRGNAFRITVHLRPRSPHEGTIMRSFYVFFVVSLSKLFNKQSIFQWFETQLSSYDVPVMGTKLYSERTPCRHPERNRGSQLDITWLSRQGREWNQLWCRVGRCW